jgi:hypothetical protein
LETNLPGTLAEGYTGELKVSFFRRGIRLKFDTGRLISIEPWIPEAVHSGDARFPNDTFLHLVCGWRRFSQLAESVPDCSATDEAAVLLDCLFPPFNGRIWMLA